MKSSNGLINTKKGGKDSENASVGDFAEAASFGDDLIVLCTSWSGTSNAIFHKVFHHEWLLML